ncbi:methyltransferase domain-containing protein [Streptomyces sp. NPDC021100]|uniref:methyltransferase domain-containing protein n=1 Tax=Streptomyces sp. NPDC021100 TaxID=3365114 RepID=UPI0037BA6C0B
MSQAVSPRELAAVRGLLTAIEADNGALPERWASAVASVPRHRFLPRVIWQRDGAGGYAPLDADTESEAWLATAYANTSIVTQVNDGQPADDGVAAFPSSSASAPSIVVLMLSMLDPQPGQQVLEIGTGTGWNAGLLAHVLGAGNVTSVEVDPVLAEQAAAVLAELTPGVTVVCGDGMLGHPNRAPYDHIMATCSLNGVSAALLAQTKAQGTILTPWSRPWCDYGLLHLTVDDHGDAQGRFHPYAVFMRARGQRVGLRLFRDVVHDDHVPAESTTNLSPWAVAGDDYDAQFALGLLLPDLWNVRHDNPDLDSVERRLWVATADGSSWAAIDDDGKQNEEFTVWQHGPRRLWDEVTAAWAWFEAHGRPSPGRFGMTVTADGTHRAWLDAPENTVAPTTGAT